MINEKSGFLKDLLKNFFFLELMILESVVQRGDKHQPIGPELIANNTQLTKKAGLFDSLFVLIINRLHDQFQGISRIAAKLSADAFIVYFGSRFYLANH